MYLFASYVKKFLIPKNRTIMNIMETSKLDMIKLSTHASDKPVITIRIILIGDAGVGKTSIIQQLSCGAIPTEYHPTIGIEYTGKTLSTDSALYKVQIWDTAGQERFRSIIRFYYRNVFGCIVVFDMTDRKSFENIKSWIDDYYKHRNSDHAQNIGLKDTMIICGNKSDLKNKYEVSLGEISELAKNYGCKYYVMSALYSDDVIRLITDILEEITDTKNICVNFTKQTFSNKNAVSEKKILDNINATPKSNFNFNKEQFITATGCNC